METIGGVGRATGAATGTAGDAEPTFSRLTPARRIAAIHCAECQTLVRDDDYFCPGCGNAVRAAEVLVTLDEVPLRFRASAADGAWRAFGRCDDVPSPAWHTVPGTHADPYTCVGAAVGRTAGRLAAELKIDPDRGFDCRCEVVDTAWCFRVRVEAKRDGTGFYHAVVTPVAQIATRPGAVGSLDLWVLRHGSAPVGLDAADPWTCLGEVAAALLRAVDGLLGVPNGSAPGRAAD